MKLCSRKMASGSAKMVCDSHTVQQDPARSQPTYCRSSGMSAICSGTTCSAKTATKSMLRPLNSIHANP
jgi:hypothetical protein